MKRKYLLMVFLMLAGLVNLFPQTSSDIGKQKDNSKPTNVYSQVDNFLEFKNAPDFYSLGYNGRVSYTLNEDNLMLAEIPFRYISNTKKFGLSDIRMRYFYIPYRNYSKFLGSFGASLDIYAPVGKYEYGLGSSSWRFSPGIIIGLMANKSGTISFFPGISYLYTSKPRSDAVPEELKEADHGFTVQLLSSFVISDDWFVQITPIWDVKDFNDTREDEFILEVEPVFDIYRDKFQCGVFYRGEYKSNIHTFSIYFTLFL